MAQEVQAGLKLIAVMDGASINGYLRVENTPLIQRYNDAGAQGRLLPTLRHWPIIRSRPLSPSLSIPPPAR